MSEINEKPRSIRRAEIMGNRDEVLASFGEYSFTIKNARDFFKYYEYGGLVEGFFVKESFLIHYIWKTFFPEHRSTEIAFDPPRLIHHHIDWVAKDSADRLLAARRGAGFFIKFVKLVRESLIAKGLMVFDKRIKEKWNDSSDSQFKLTDDGSLLSSATWFAPLTKDKADALIAQMVERAEYIAKHPNEFLCSVKLLGVFGSYTDDRLSSYNDLDILHEITRNTSRKEGDDEYSKWCEKADALFKKDGRKHQGVIAETYDWPRKKTLRYLKKRNPRLRTIGMVSIPIRLKIVYLHPYGALDTPIWRDFPDGTPGTYMWHTITP